MLNFIEVNKFYKQGDEKLQILSGLDLKVDPGEKVAIIGESGSGKSTLLSLIAGLEKANSGITQVFGKEFQSLSEDEICELRGKKMGIVFQNYYLVPYLTALENIQLSLIVSGVDEVHGSVENILERIKLLNRKSHFPHQMSGGECQRIAIARSIIHKPKLILADEPSGNLDEATGNSVMDLLFEMTEFIGATLVLVTHNIKLSERCDKVYLLQHGKLEKK